MREAMQRGESKPERCPDCRKTHNKATARMGAPYIDLAPGYLREGAKIKPGRLGTLRHPNRRHNPVELEQPQIQQQYFGITDELAAEFIREFDSYQVAIVTAPTGSGKSTFFPYRLMEPPKGIPEDHFTRHGRIVVTQPRIEASSSIPKYVSEQLHGSKSGAGRDIGFRNSRSRETDTRNKILYLTDGTLLNMIRKGELHDIGVIIIDEAHERSLNIDLIIALLRRELHALPHLKLIIASATIDVTLFKTYFEPDYKVLHWAFPGKPGFPVHSRFRPQPAIPEKQLVSEMPTEVAKCAYEVLKWMAFGERPVDIGPDSVCLDGDILCFVHGKKAIQNTKIILDELLEDGDTKDRNKTLAGCVEILPLHAELPTGDIKKALGITAKKTKNAARRKWRVVISTNIAETSLTVEGIRHVIDSGLINQTVWDSETVTTSLVPKLHSKSGLLQRKGRAGRVAPGMWHCLLTEEQFNALEADTPPEITRAPLEAVVLAASIAGINNPSGLRWLPPGAPQRELLRSAVILRQVGAIGRDGIPTSLGRELGSSRESISHASLLACADSAGCAVEAATLLAAVRLGGMRKLLLWSKKWSSEAKLHVDRLHSALFAKCRDDLDSILTLWAAWEREEPKKRQAWAERRFLSFDNFCEWSKKRAEVLASLQMKTKTAEVRQLSATLSERLRWTIVWSFPDTAYAKNGNGEYSPLVTPRTDQEAVEKLHSGAAVLLDAISRCNARVPEVFFALDRKRNSRWVSPLDAPQYYVEVSVCVSADKIPNYDSRLMSQFIKDNASETNEWQFPDILPGDRFKVDDDGRTLTIRERLKAINYSTIELYDGDDSSRVSDDDAETADITSVVIEDEYDGEYVSDDDDRVSESFGGRASNESDCCGVSSERIVRPPTTETIEKIIVSGIEEDGAVISESDDRKERMSVFARDYKMGDRVSLCVDSVVRLQLEKNTLVILRHPETKLLFTLDRTFLGLDCRDVLLRELSGRTLAFSVDYIDVDNEIIEVSCVRDILAKLKVIFQARVINAEIIDAEEDAIFAVCRDGAAGMDFPYIGLMLQSQLLPKRPSEMRRGQTARISVKPRTQISGRCEIAGISEPEFTNSAYKITDGCLSIEHPATGKDIEKIMKLSEKYDFETGLLLRAAARALALRSHRPRFTVIDVTGIQQIADDENRHGIIKEINPYGLNLIINGHEEFVRSKDVSWTSWNRSAPLKYRIGDEVPLYLLHSDPENGELKLSIRDPGANPYEMLRIGGIVDCVIISVEDRPDGASFAVLEAPGGARMFLPGRETGVPRGDSLNRALTVGMERSVRVIEADSESEEAACSLYLFEERLALPDKYLLLIKGKGNKTSLRAFRQLGGQNADIYPDNQNGHAFIIKSLDRQCGQNIYTLIKKALAGPFVCITLPHINPFSQNNNLLQSVGNQFGVCLNLCKNEGANDWLLYAATPNRETAESLLNCLLQFYMVRNIILGQHHKENFQKAQTEAKEKGVYIRKSGTFDKDTKRQPAQFEWRTQADDVVAFNALNANGIAYSDGGRAYDGRVLMKEISATSVLPPVQVQESPRAAQSPQIHTAQKITPQRMQQEKTITLNSIQMQKLIKPRLFSFGSSIIERIEDRYNIRYKINGNVIVIYGNARDVEDACGEIHGKI
jgi:HrpA-like RNA helicase